jgi:hypothetical protein
MEDVSTGHLSRARVKNGLELPHWKTKWGSCKVITRAKRKYWMNNSNVCVVLVSFSKVLFYQWCFGLHISKRAKVIQCLSFRCFEMCFQIILDLPLSSKYLLFSIDIFYVSLVLAWMVCRQCPVVRCRDRCFLSMGVVCI